MQKTSVEKVSTRHAMGVRHMPGSSGYCTARILMLRNHVSDE
jgi:hypothetical protein